MGVVKSKKSENKSITFNIVSNLSQSMSKIHVMSLRWLLKMSSISTELSQRWIRHHKLLMSPAPTLEKISLDPSSIPHEFTYVTAVVTITSKPNITETTVLFDVSLSQY